MLKTASDRPDSRAKGVRSLLVQIVLILLIALLYGPTLGFPFVHWDDDRLIAENPYLDPSGRSLGPLLGFHGYAGLFMPITYLAWFLLRSLSVPLAALGLIATDAPQPALFHAFSLLAFMILSLVVFRLCRRWTDSLIVSFLATALFVTHPAQVESVAWVSEQKGLLSLLFGSAAIHAHLRSIETADDTRSGRWAMGAWLLFVLACLCKPWGAVVPLLAAIVDRGSTGRTTFAIARSLAPWVLVSIGVVEIARRIQAPYLEFITPIEARPLVVVATLIRYLRLLVVPWPLGPDEGMPADQLVAEWGLGARLGASLAVAVMLMAGILWWRRPSWWGMPALFFVAALAPVLGVVPFAYQTISTIADRYMLPALVAVSILATLVMERYRSIAVRVAVGVVIVLWGGLSHQQMAAWQSDDALIEQALRVRPASAPFLSNRSKLHLDRGEYVLAEADARQSLSSRPGYLPAYSNLAVAEARQGKIDAALGTLAEASERRPEDQSPRELAVQILLRAGRWDEAVVAARRLVALTPSAPADELLARALILSGQEKEGVKLFTKARGLPDSPAAEEWVIAGVLEEAGEVRRAAERLERLVEEFRGAQAFKARLAALRAGTFDPAERDPAQSLRLLDSIPQRTGRAGVEDMATRSVALAATGKFEDAISLAERAQRRARELGFNDWAPSIEEKLARYRQQQPWHTEDPRLVDRKAVGETKSK